MVSNRSRLRPLLAGAFRCLCCIFFLAGCGPERVILAQNGTTPAPAEAIVAKPSPVTRLQKPDVEKPKADIQKTTFELFNEPFTGAPDNRATVRIRARVNNMAILEEEIRDATLPILIQLSPSERAVREQAIINQELQKIIDRELIIQDLEARFGKQKKQYLDKLKEGAGKEFDKHLRAIKANYEKQTGKPLASDDDLKKILLSQGVSFEGYRRQFERNFMSMEYLRARIFPIVQGSVGHQQIVDFYEQHAAEFEVPDSVDWQDIFVNASKFATRAEAHHFAVQLATRAQQGEDFARLAEQFDHGDSADRHGAGIGHRHGEIRPGELEPVLFNLKDGEVGPIVEIGTGFHVVRVVKRYHAGRKPLDDKTQSEIRKKLQYEVLDRETRRLVSELRRKASIEVVGSKR